MPEGLYIYCPLCERPARPDPSTPWGYFCSSCQLFWDAFPANYDEDWG